MRRLWPPVEGRHKLPARDRARLACCGSHHLRLSHGYSVSSCADVQSAQRSAPASCTAGGFGPSVRPSVGQSVSRQVIRPVIRSAWPVWCCVYCSLGASRSSACYIETKPAFTRIGQLNFNGCMRWRLHLHKQECSLTLRSSGTPTAWRAGYRAQGLRPILLSLSSAPRCWHPLSSNVSPRTPSPRFVHSGFGT